jgi:hypothetical protein
MPVKPKASKKTPQAKVSPKAPVSPVVETLPFDETLPGDLAAEKAETPVAPEPPAAVVPERGAGDAVPAMSEPKVKPPKAGSVRIEKETLGGGVVRHRRITN